MSGTRWQSHSRPLLTALSIVAGVSIGLGLFTFGYARGAAYLTNDPSACANCHVMRNQYESWMKSSHRAAAVCNDCHSPPGLIPKYGTKLRNGFFHSLAFTTGDFPDEIQITGFNHKVTQGACIKCHEDLVTGIQGTRGYDERVNCIQCHAHVGHQ